MSPIFRRRPLATLSVALVALVSAAAIRGAESPASVRMV